MLTAQAVGFPRFKLKSDDDDIAVYRDSHQADGSVAVLSNRCEGTLEVTVPPPERGLEASPWEGMSGAALWIGGRIVGVIAKHHHTDGLGRLAAARCDLALDSLDPGRRAELRALLDLPETLPDVVPPSTGEWLTNAYQVQVREIAPDELLDREEELGELVRFCAGDRPYAWWQAGPWAGKSVLMSWFVLHPPAGVDVVSFFVTARLAGQSDSDACTDALIEQLAALLGESPASVLTVGARWGTLLKLLANAASRSREVGRRLLLVIDGLDEDTGTSSSIAALLPRRPPPEVRILVASRPHPPIPDDVAGDHPLRTINPRQLDVFVHARDIERRAKLELKQLLGGRQLQRDLLGLITAAGGGLTLDDLEELTTWTPHTIQGVLDGLFGRSVDSRTQSAGFGRTEERVYLFAHETLRHVAQQQFGNSLITYCDRLHGWADTWRDRRWPPDTPQYLLRSYPRMLVSVGDLTRLVACTTDQVRHDRMRDLTGGDALAVAEINTAQQLILARPDPDLTSLALLAVQREHLTHRNYFVPINLPPIWAMLGQPTHAEALASSIPDPHRRAQALTSLVEVAAKWGDHDRIDQLVSAIEAVTVQVGDPIARAQVMGPLAGVMARIGNRTQATQLAEEVARLADDAETLITQITNLIAQGIALCAFVEAVAASGDHYRAETLTTQIIEPGLRAEALGRLATLIATGGDRDWATRLINEAERLPPSKETVFRDLALIQLVEATAALDDHVRAETLTTQIIEPGLRAEALGRLAARVAAGGDRTQGGQLVIDGEALIGQVADSDQRAWALCQLAEAAYVNDDCDRATRLLSEAEACTGQFADASEDERAEVLCQLAHAMVISGEQDRAARLSIKAEAFAEQMTSPSLRAEVLCQLAEMAVASGDRDRAARLISKAEAVTAMLIDPYPTGDHTDAGGPVVTSGGDFDRDEALNMQVVCPPGPWEHALTRLVGAVAAHGDYGRAEVLVMQIPDSGLRAWALGRLAEVMAKEGDHDQVARLVNGAETLTTQLPDPFQQALALSQLATAVFAGGDQDQAIRLADEAEALAAQVTDPRTQAGVFVQLVELATAGCDYDRAEGIIAQIVEPDQRARALGRLAQAVDADGDHDRAARLVSEAEALTDQISNHYQRAKALAGVAVALRTITENTTGVREHQARKSSHALVRSRALFAEALVIGPWSAIVSDLALVDASAVSALADELEVRSKLAARADP